MFELKPKDGNKKIDLVYAKAVYDYHIDSEEEFNKLDVDNKGNALPKIILYRK